MTMQLEMNLQDDAALGSQAEAVYTPAIRFKGFSGAWEVKALGEITDSFSGGTPQVGNKDFYAGEIPFIRSGEINSNSTEIFISDIGLKSSSARLVSIGTILYALYGATSGEVGISKINGAINQAVLAIIPHNGISNSFIMQWLRKNKSKIIGMYLQGGQGNLSGTIVKNLVVDLPSSEEQTAIGNYFQQLDSLIAQHQHKHTKLLNLKQALLQKMFPKQGATVPEVRFKGFSGDWEVKSLGDLCEQTYGGGTPTTTNLDYWDGEIPWIQSSDLSDSQLMGVKPIRANLSY